MEPSEGPSLAPLGCRMYLSTEVYTIIRTFTSRGGGLGLLIDAEIGQQVDQVAQTVPKHRFDSARDVRFYSSSSEIRAPRAFRAS